MKKESRAEAVARLGAWNPTAQKRKTVTLWVSEAVMEFLEDRSMSVLLTQLYKTKGESRPIAITLQKEVSK